MNSLKNMGAIALVVVAVAAVVVARQWRSEPKASLSEPEVPAAAQGSQTEPGLPRLVDLGAGKCIPCKAMAPILDELRETYAGRMEVVFIDVWENPEEGRRYGVKLIPTQVFFDAEGRELYRHEGFMGRDDILAAWKKLGLHFEESSLPES